MRKSAGSQDWLRNAPGGKFRDVCEIKRGKGVESMAAPKEGNSI